MKNKAFAFIVLLIFFSSIYPLSAKSTDTLPTPLSPFKYAIKNNTQFTHHYKQNTFTLLPISPAYFQRTKSGNAHEFELNRVNISQFDSRSYDYGISQGSLYRRFDLLLRYQFNYYFIKRQTKLSPYLGGSVLGLIGTSKDLPANPDLFPWNSTYTGIYFALAPGFNFNISKRVFLDLSIPLDIYGLSYHRTRYKNPAWSTREQIYSTSTYNELMLHKFYTVRFGLGVNF